MENDPPIADFTATDDDEPVAVRKAQEIIERSSPTVNQVCLITLTLMAVIYTLYFAAAVILPFVLALVLTALLSPALQFMNRRLRIPRVIAALVLIFAVLTVVWAVGYLVVVPRLKLDRQNPTIHADFD
jgi:predicted PurR-regulated permease PerM